MSPTILVAVTDIFFYTKVRDTLRPQGYTLERIRSQDEVAGKTASASPAALILNMNDLAIDAFTALETLRADPALRSLPILAFANHEETDTWRRAKELGVTKIVSRNEFSARTRELVEDIIANSSQQSPGRSAPNAEG
ncbi:MAG: histidine kinase [Nitrospira sp.]|nr:histidine kinase [Nitrospira sp.]